MRPIFCRSLLAALLALAVVSANAAGLDDSSGGLNFGRGLEWHGGVGGGSLLSLRNLAPGGFISGWTTGGATLGQFVAGDPFGGSQAARITEDTSIGALHEINTSAAVTVTPNATYTCEGYIKVGSSGTRNVAVRFLDGSTFINQFGEIFNPSTGAAVASIAGGTGANSGAPSSVSVGNGWFKVSVTGSIGNFASAFFYFLLYSGTTGSYTGDGASNDLVYGPFCGAGTAAP